MISLIISAAGLFSPSLGYPTVTRPTGPDCFDFFIPINDATSLNRQIEDFNLTTTASVDSLLALIASSNTSTYTTVTASFNVSARYCEPEVKIPSRASSIQFLVHGITYNKDYWSALGFPGYDPEIYSWIEYASQRGYPTLSVDRVGYGNSSHPDPYGIDQVPMQAAVLSQIMRGLKAGDVLGRQFSRVIYVGHSHGSIIGEAVAAMYPDSADGLVLTGYSAKADSTNVLSTAPFPAALFSSRFAGLNTGYVVTSYAPSRELVLYGHNGTFDPKVSELDFQTQDTVSIGELITGSSPPLGPLATNFMGPVAVITGEQDAVYCYVNATIGGYCGQGDDSLPSQAREFFPNASSFSYFIPGNMGHDINLHYRAHIAYAYAHDWLEFHGF
jgi:pimeloyl-ACP methyl ester carboxylesterase